MKRAGRWMFNFAAAVSAALLIATLNMVVRSAIVDEGVGRWVYAGNDRGRDFGQDHLHSYGGRLDYQGFRIHAPAPFNAGRGGSYAEEAPRGWTYSRERAVNRAQSWLVPFSFYRSVSPDGLRTDWRFYIAYWPLVLTWSLLPWWSIRRMLYLRRVQRGGLCPACGYDLRATPDRCPECGAIPPAAKGSAGGGAC